MTFASRIRENTKSLKAPIQKYENHMKTKMYIKNMEEIYIYIYLSQTKTFIVLTEYKYWITGCFFFPFFPIH